MVSRNPKTKPGGAAAVLTRPDFTALQPAKPSVPPSLAPVEAAAGTESLDAADTAASLLLPVKPIGPDMNCQDLHDFFIQQNLSMQSIPVVYEGRPLGLVTRYTVVDKFSRRYFRELHGKASVSAVMNPSPLVVESDMPLDQLSKLVSREGSHSLADGFIITKGGLYLGMGTGRALVRELADRKQAQLAAALKKSTAELEKAQEGLLAQERMKKELAIAQEIQMALLPRKTPEIPGYTMASLYQPALEVGGDYFDFIPLSGGRLAFAVADVSGKGVPGSIGMTMARTVLRAQALSDRLPGDTLRRANEVMLPDMRSGMFITVFYCLLDPLRHSIHMACAGHNPAYHIDAKGAVRSVAPEGMALGLGPQEMYFVDEASLQMDRGDYLVLYTDGITEAMDASEEEYGEARFVASLARHAPQGQAAMMQGIMDDLNDFTEDAPQTDDITLVILHRAHHGAGHGQA
jgi:serine phosphatase RsbU (regulator of sigma subunit)